MSEFPQSRFIRLWEYNQIAGGLEENESKEGEAAY